jgi:hypothetical protein
VSCVRPCDKPQGNAAVCGEARLDRADRWLILRVQERVPSEKHREVQKATSGAGRGVRDGWAGCECEGE